MPALLLDILNWPYLPALLMFGVMAPLVAYASVTLPVKKHARWERMGLDFGLRVNPCPSGMLARARYRPKLYGYLAGRVFQMEEEIRGSGKYQATWTIARLDGSPPLSRALHAVHEGMGHRLMTRLGVKEATLGDPEMDRALYFKALPDEDRAVLLQEPIRTALLELLREHPLTLERGSVCLSLKESLQEREQRQLIFKFRQLAEVLAAEQHSQEQDAHRQA